MSTAFTRTKTLIYKHQVKRLTGLIKFVSLILLFSSQSACTYMKYSSVQANYARIQSANPGQVNLKHMLDRETFFVIGKTIDSSGRYRQVSMAVAAYSSKYKDNERVDTMYFQGAGTHFGLNLPAGNYTLVVYADMDGNGVFDQTETVGVRGLDIDSARHQEKIVSHINVDLTFATPTAWVDVLQMPASTANAQSIFYPSGTIRHLDDPIFDPSIATLGMYDPASFLEHAPTMFYAEEEDVAHKIPVIFVHGIDGSSRSFQPLVAQLDRDRYKSWYFYYPSGGDLDQLAAFFYNIFLSGEVIPMGEMPMVIVAHSMGGLVVREALNKYQGSARENRVELFFTIATPFGGHPSAASGEKHGLIVLPAWRDLNPASEFISNLYRKPLPDFVNHQLLYAYQNSQIVKIGSNSDGVVPLSSQLDARAQKQSSESFGFNSGHVDVLRNQEMITHVLTKISKVKSVFPESHIKILLEGGFDVALDDHYSPITRYIIRYAGKYLALLVNDRIEPVNAQHERFIQAIRGKVLPGSDLEREFRNFLQENHNMVDEYLVTWKEVEYQ